MNNSNKKTILDLITINSFSESIGAHMIKFRANRG